MGPTYQNTTFIACSTTRDGGAIYMAGSNPPGGTVQTSAFINCRSHTPLTCSAHDGGGVHGRFNLSRSAFTNCSAGYRGGAAFLWGVRTTVGRWDFTDHSCHFVSCTGELGSAVYVTDLLLVCPH